MQFDIYIAFIGYGGCFRSSNVIFVKVWDAEPSVHVVFLVELNVKVKQWIWSLFIIFTLIS